MGPPRVAFSSRPIPSRRPVEKDERPASKRFIWELGHAAPSAAAREMLNRCSQGQRPNQHRRPNYGKYWMYHVRRMLQANHSRCGPLQSTARVHATALPTSDRARSKSLSAPADRGLVQPRRKRHSYSTEHPGSSPAASPALVNAHLAICLSVQPPRDHRTPLLALVGPHLGSQIRAAVGASEEETVRESEQSQPDETGAGPSNLIHRAPGPVQWQLESIRFKRLGWLGSSYFPAHPRGNSVVFSFPVPTSSDSATLFSC